MKNIARLSLAIAALAITSAASSAEAQQLPLSFSRRPLTLTARTLRGDVNFAISHLETTVLGVTASSTGVGLSLGAGYGIIDDLEVGATVIPLTLSPSFNYNAPSVYGVYRFVRGNIDVGAQLALTFPIDRDFGMRVGVPVLIHLGDGARLDTGAFLDLSFGDPLGKSLSIPLSFAANINPNLYLGARTGIVLPNFDAFAMPLGVFVGYTIAGGGGNSPLADITAAFDFPLFIATGRNDTVYAGLWTASLNGRIFFNL